ncbi:MAG: oxygen-binding di-iron domain-containing protein [Candidatus Kariarchaeaceae archaeon]
MRTINPEEAYEIKRGVWWVGWPDHNAGFSNNPYLMIEGDEVVLFDPGSRLEEHWNAVKKKIESVIPLEKITMIIVHHQDPDLCASIPFIEEIKGINNFELVTTPRSALFLPYYGIQTEVTTVNDGDTIEIGTNGRKLKFITSPYLHSPGAMTTYDPKEKILFSSDIFGAFSIDWSLFANEHYIEAMKSFLEPYMSGKNHVVNFLNKLGDYEIKTICPQHGSIIIEEKVKEAIEVLYNLEVGIWK